MDQEVNAASRAVAVERSDAMGPLRAGKIRKADALHHLLQRRILLGELAAGAMVAEQHLAAEFDLSQGTVREALMRLEKDGLVARRGYGGTVVSTTSTAEAVHMVKIRIELELAGAARVAGRLPTASRSALVGIIEEMGRASAANDAYACSELDRDFHATLFRASGLDTLEPILRRCALHMHRFTVHERPEFFAAGDIVEGHRHILEVIETGEVGAAREVLREHVMEVISQWSPVLSDALLNDELDTLDRHDPPGRSLAR